MRRRGLGPGMRAPRRWLAGAGVVLVLALVVWPWGASVYLSHQGDNVPVVVTAGGREVYRDVLGCTREVEPGVFQTKSPCIVRVDAALSPLVPLTVQAGNATATWRVFVPGQPHLIIRAWHGDLQLEQQFQAPKFL